MNVESGEGSVSVSTGGNSVEIKDGGVNMSSTSGGNTSTANVGNGNSSVLVGDIQQNQYGVGKNDTVKIDSQSTEEATSMDAGDGRRVIVKNGQVFLQRDGVGAITLPQHDQ